MEIVFHWWIWTFFEVLLPSTFYCCGYNFLT